MLHSVVMLITLLESQVYIQYNSQVKKIRTLGFLKNAYKANLL